jgi:hypothetical protein
VPSAADRAARSLEDFERPPFQTQKVRTGVGNRQRVHRISQPDRLQDAHHLVIDVDRAQLVVDLAHLVDDQDRMILRPQEIGEHGADRPVADDRDIIVRGAQASAPRFRTGASASRSRVKRAAFRLAIIPPTSFRFPRIAEAEPAAANERHLPPAL